MLDWLATNFIILCRQVVATLSANLRWHVVVSCVGVLRRSADVICYKVINREGLIATWLQSVLEEKSLPTGLSNTCT